MAVIETVKLGDVHPDMERYLQEDCYCFGEIYGVDGFFFQVYGISDECRVIEHSDERTAVVATTSGNGKPDSKPQAIMFWHDEGDGRIIEAQRIDATENNNQGIACAFAVLASHIASENHCGGNWLVKVASWEGDAR